MGEPESGREEAADADDETGEVDDTGLDSFLQRDEHTRLFAPGGFNGPFPVGFCRGHSN